MIRSTLLLGSKSVSTTLVNSTSERLLSSFPIPSGGLSPFGTLARLYAWGDLVNNTTDTRTLTLRFKLSEASTATLTSSAISVTTSTARRPWQLQSHVVAEGSSDQRALTNIIFGAGNTIANGASTHNGHSSITTKVTAQLSVASSNFSVVCNGGYLELLRFPIVTTPFAGAIAGVGTVSGALTQTT